MVNHVMLIMSIVVLAINFNNCYFMDIRYTPFINTPTGFRINQNLRLVPYVMVDTKSLYPPALVICCVYPTRCFFLKWCLFFSAMLSNSYFFIMYRKKKKKKRCGFAIMGHDGCPKIPWPWWCFPFRSPVESRTVWSWKDLQCGTVRWICDQMARWMVGGNANKHIINIYKH